MIIGDLKDRIAALTEAALKPALNMGNHDAVEAVIDIPRDVNHGDFSTPVALGLAKKFKKKPRDIAEKIVNNLPDSNNLLASPPTIEGPGFINYRISDKTWREAIRQVLKKGDEYGKTDIGRGEKVMVEFVSANPTGPLHIGHARNAAVGDSMARILAFTGHDVVKEFYVNDQGNQVDMLAKTVHGRLLESLGKKVDWDKTFPDGNYYPGEYIKDIVEKRLKPLEQGERLKDISPGNFDIIERKTALEALLDEIKHDLGDFNITFDEWFRESRLYESGADRKTLEKLGKQGDIYEKEGALWFRVSKYEEGEEDRVIRKSGGDWTYFASDITYHRDKLERGFERLVNVWGADHHGYIGRVRAALKALGLPPDHLQILLVQMVNLVRDGVQVRMGKRTGEFIALRELLDEVGADAMRFTFLTRSANSHLDFDVDALKMKPGDDSEVNVGQLREKNPVYYVQYAHARANAIFRKAREKGIDPDAYRTANMEKLVHPEELDLARKMERFPREAAQAATDAEPHRISHYLLELAGDFHRYYYKGDRDRGYRVLCEDEETAAARMALAAAVAAVIRNGLTLLGVQSPERM